MMTWTTSYDDKPVKGDPMYTAEHNGAVYRFASAEHRDMFNENPDKYAPQYGGYCAYSIARGSVAPSSPEDFTIQNGRLYLNASPAIRAVWAADMATFIHEADANWPSILDR